VMALAALAHENRLRIFRLLVKTGPSGMPAGEIADRVAVMYAGHVVEQSPARDLLERPLHPYTRALLASVPKLSGNGGRLTPIPGAVPRPGEFPPGCRFAPRCSRVRPECSRSVPELVEVEPKRWVRCPFWK